MATHSSVLAWRIPGTGGAWWAAIYGVAQSQTRLKWLAAATAVFSWRRQWHPLQSSCLENPMDGGAWWAAAHEVAKSRTQPSDVTFTFHFHALEKEMALHSSVLAWRTPGTGEPGGLQSMGSLRVGHDWSDLAAAAAIFSSMGGLFPFPWSQVSELWQLMSWLLPGHRVITFSIWLGFQHL